MKKYMKILTVLLCWSIICIGQTPELSNLSNTTLLKNKEQTQEILAHFGFQKIYFNTSDNYKLCGLFLDQSKISKEPIKGTLIFTAGFYPGKKEAIATFYQIFAHLPYNFLFFDARRHNESEGNLFDYTYLKQYGLNEHLDITAAIEFLENYNKEHAINPHIFLLGLCSGAFHSVRSVHNLAQTNPQSCQHVKGIIFDSGWSTLSDVVEPSINADLHRRLQDSCVYFLIKPLFWLMTGIYRFLFKAHHQQVNSLNEMIQHIHCPILFIHSQHDSYAPIEPVKKLAQQAKKCSCWWPESESHATCHLKHQAEYTSQVQRFLEEA